MVLTARLEFWRGVKGWVEFMGMMATWGSTDYIKHETDLLLTAIRYLGKRPPRPSSPLVLPIHPPPWIRIYVAPTMAASEVSAYYYSDTFDMKIYAEGLTCTENWYYWYDGWNYIGPGGELWLRMRVPSDNYHASYCTLYQGSRKTDIDLKQPESFNTTVPTQLSSLI